MHPARSAGGLLSRRTDPVSRCPPPRTATPRPRVHRAAEVVQRVGRASGSAGAMGAMLVLLGLAFWFGASAATVAHWSANLLLSVAFLSLINAVGKA